MPIRPLVKYHGGKGRLHQWILSHIPNHSFYIEPFGGAASVLLNKSISSREIYNEIEPNMFNLMHVVKNHFVEFNDLVRPINYSQDNFEQHQVLFKNQENLSFLEKAVSFYVVKRMSRSGWCKQYCWSQRKSADGVPSETNAWLTSLDNLKKVHDRLQNVELSNQDAFKLIAQHCKDKDVLFYLDPPYLISTRVYQDAYDFELSVDQHEQLANLLNSAESKVALSGYPSLVYSQWYSKWNLTIKHVPNNCSMHNYKSKLIKQECLWTNYA